MPKKLIGGLKNIGIAILLIGLGYIIYLQIIQNTNLLQSKQFIIAQLKNQGLFISLILIFILCINFIFEAIKWQQLCGLFQHISFTTALKAVLVGQTFALNTPNRAGDFVGKLFFIEKKNKSSGIFLSIYGNFSQMIIALSMANIAIFMGVYIIKIPAILHWHWLVVGFPIMCLINVFLLIIFFKIHIFILLLNKIQIFKNKNIHLTNINLTNHFKINLLFISLLRYFCATFSYICLMKLFNINIDLQTYILLFIFLGSIYFVPSLSVADISVRGQLGIFILNTIVQNPLIVIAITSFIWLLNLLLPAIIGYFILISKNIFINFKKNI